MKRKLVLVTGAGGFLGSHITRELLAENYQVRALLAPNESSENLNDQTLQIEEGDIRKKNVVDKAAKGATHIIHCAALNKLWHRPSREYFEINLKGTKNILHAAEHFKVERLIYTSSCEVMGPSQNAIPRTEQWKCAARSIRGHYAQSKSLAEAKVRRHLEARAVILRPTVLLGPGDIHQTPFGQFLQAYFNRQLPAYYNCGINLIDVRDAAKAHLSALDCGKLRRAYIIGGYNVRLEDVLQKIARLSGVQPPKRKLSYHSAHFLAGLYRFSTFFTRQTPVFTPQSVKKVKHPNFFNNSFAKNTLSLQLRSIDETIAATVNWYQQKELS